ncbi:hypothetical protein ACFFJY_14060 [Fictibacillus aquaticus]|uniref:Uncharacterized protein n=1 Tax=Fictibacillus aquaticus TaxID=2021314 RepID=A0A235FED5_9BACL|nr:hypothetical protein [Fictibacillus aquaticus]OYD59343.1 hypothetical protein CGZ90_05485 [Fictibacillus aquaticus]
MKENLTFAWVAAWFALAGQLLFFIGVAIYTGEWRYVMWSFIVSMAAGVPSIIHVWKAKKALDSKKVSEM